MTARIMTKPAAARTPPISISSSMAGSDELLLAGSAEVAESIGTADVDVDVD